MCGHFNTTWHVNSTVQCFVNKQYRDSTNTLFHTVLGQESMTQHSLCPESFWKGKRVKWLMQRKHEEERQKRLLKMKAEEEKRQAKQRSDEEGRLQRRAEEEERIIRL